MKDQLKKVEDFQNAFSQLVNTSPVLVPYELASLRYDLMKEENEEYLLAVSNDNLVEIADALGDQLYILCGTILSHGMGEVIDLVFNEIHRSNMSKLDEKGRPIINGQKGVLDPDRPVGKILKSKNYTMPNLNQFLP